jgi:segregation and condensation protein A
MRELNLEIAGEYLVMAATLMHIKSRLLLPADPEESADGASVDPRDEIVQQLLEYQRFKQAAESLQALETRRTLIWTRHGIPAGFEGEELLAVDMFDLLRAFRGVLGRLGEDVARQLRRDTVSVADKIAWLTDLLEQRPSLPFSELLESLPTRLDRIAAFLAVLELVRLQAVVAFQRGIGGAIHLARPAAEACSTEDA